VALFGYLGVLTASPCDIMKIESILSEKYIALNLELETRSR